MAKEAKEKEGSSTVVIALSALLALGAAGGVYYFYEQARKAEDLLIRSKDEYKKMAAEKKAVEEFLRARKGRATVVDSSEDMMVFLDKKSREAQMPPGSIQFGKAGSRSTGSWTETTYSGNMMAQKDAPIRKLPVVDFLRRVEFERRSTKVSALSINFSGDDFKSANITFSQFTPKQ